MARNLCVASVYEIKSKFILFTHALPVITTNANCFITSATTVSIAIRSYYTRRKFRPIYAKVMNSYVNTCRKSSTFQRHPGANSMSLVTGLLPFTSEMALFEFPFNELLVSENQNQNNTAWPSAKRKLV